jgi:hypothetical protein
VGGKVERARLYRNTVSYFGGLIVLVAVLMTLLLFAINVSVKTPSPYFGILLYMVAPGIMTLGILIFLYGTRRESKRRRRVGSDEAPPYPRLDLNDVHQRRLFTIILAGGSLLGIMLCFLGYNAYLFTDSTTFCGGLCHRVMKPEYTAYQKGPHARVACVDCHVGTGVPWYVKSKISGVPQVFATLFDTYSKPIPVPIKNLRPAREICEECHWPEKFYGAQLMQNPHFRYDEKNTAEQINLLLRTGGGTPNLGANAGIHWHMIINKKVYFRAADPQQQQIPWVMVVQSNGSSAVYRDSRAGATAGKINALPVRLMDCMDCHNRPSHVFLPPETAVDLAMEGGNISSKLPWIKKLAVDALTKDYSKVKDVHRDILESIGGYYAKNYPGAGNLREQAGQAAGVVAKIYDQNVFPSMNVNWTTYPNNIGHRNWPGCFRCHDGFHRNEAGDTLVKSCTVCHTMPQRGPLLPLGTTVMFGKEPWHPFPLEGKHEQVLCNICHRAGYRPPAGCAACHKLPQSAPMMSSGCDICHLKGGEVKPIASCTSCHESLGGLHKADAHAGTDCTACHSPHTWRVAGRATCVSCHEERKQHYPSQFCGECHSFLGETKGKAGVRP